MNSKELVINVLRAQGKADALSLRTRASGLSGTEIIAEEDKIPEFDPKKDYTGWPRGAPVYDLIDGEKQVFTLLIPHNAAHYPGVRPNNNRTLWSLTHTKDPAKAKAFIPPNGISGLYMEGEVCADFDGNGTRMVYRSKVNDNPYAPSEYAGSWELIGPYVEVMSPLSDE